MKRRKFLKSILKNAVKATVAIGAAGAAVSAPFAAKGGWGATRFRHLRPPGALDNTEDFLARCIRCNQCGQACPNTAIRFMGLSRGLAAWGTPYIVPREQGCILCMKCGEVCPTGAIRPVKDELQAILDNVRMGKAVLDKSQCLSYQGKTCGVCYRACPLAGVAMTIGFLEQPTVTDKCVGCGLCERVCIQTPQAIRVYPSEDQSAGEATR